METSGKAIFMYIVFCVGLISLHIVYPGQLVEIPHLSYFFQIH